MLSVARSACRLGNWFRLERMIHSNALAIFFGLASALTIAWGTVVRHRVAEDSGGSDASSVVGAITRMRWWAGLSLSFLGYAFQIVALAFGTLLVVQPILVLSLMFTLPLSAKLSGRRVSKSETSWAALLTLAVAVLVVLGRPQPGADHTSLPTWLAALGIGVVIFTLMYIVSRALPSTNRALILGSITGGIMGYVAVLSKAVTDIFTHSGAGGLLTSWELWGLIGLAAVGTAVQQASFNAGPLKNSLPAMTVVEPIFAFALGYAILGEKFDVGGYEWLYMAAALALMVVATVVLSRKSIKD